MSSSSTSEGVERECSECHLKRTKNMNWKNWERHKASHARKRTSVDNSQSTSLRKYFKPSPQTASGSKTTNRECTEIPGSTGMPCSINLPCSDEAFKESRKGKNASVADDGDGDQGDWGGAGAAGVNEGGGEENLAGIQSCGESGDGGDIGGEGDAAGDRGSGGNASSAPRCDGDGDGRLFSSGDGDFDVTSVLELELHTPAESLHVGVEADESIKVAGNKTPLSNDPASFKGKSLSVDMIDYYAKVGPCQPKAASLPNRSFPKDKHNRSFLESSYERSTSTAGEKVNRDWLTYSVSEDRVYCLHCMLYAGNIGQKSFTHDGFHAWHRMSAALIVHETSDSHVAATIKAKIRAASMPLDGSAEVKQKKQKLINREIVKHLIDVTLYLGRHCLAFRGHREGWKEKLRGNYMDLVILLAKYSPLMATYLAKLESGKKKQVSFVSWLRQNQMIDAISNFIKNVIKKELSDAKVFSISMDTTFDSSRSEQLSFIIRYVDDVRGSVVERIVAMRETSLTTGERLFEVFKEICRDLGIDWTGSLVGQSYDGASNMSSEYKGLQGRIQSECPSAIYIWCSAHRLNLVVTDFVSCCTNASEMFGNLETLHNFVGSSKKRSRLYKDHQAELCKGQRRRRLQRVSTTRWMSHGHALDTALTTFDAVVATLDSIVNSTGSEERTAVSQAIGLQSYFLSKKFLYTALSFKKIFDIIGPVNKFLQASDIDLLASVNYLERAKTDIECLRNDVAFDEIEREVESFISKHEHLQFAELPTPRPRRVPTRLGELAADEPISDPRTKFKVETYLKSLDTILMQFSERFGDKIKGLYKDLSLFSRKRLLQVSKDPSLLPKDAFDHFSKLYSKHVNCEALKKEYLQFSKAYADSLPVLNLPQFLHRQQDSPSPLLEDDEDPDDVGYESSSDSDSDAELSDNGDGLQSQSEAPDGLRQPENSGSMIDIYRLLLSCGLKNVFPTFYLALKIALTLPVSSAKAERTFSKLKIVKNRLRSTMCNDRLEGLMVIACEPDIAIDYEEVMTTFAAASPLLANLL